MTRIDVDNIKRQINPDDIIDYLELLMQIIGVDMPFEKFKNMSNSDRKAFIRNIKINKALNEK